MVGTLVPVKGLVTSAHFQEITWNDCEKWQEAISNRRRLPFTKALRNRIVNKDKF